MLTNCCTRRAAVPTMGIFRSAPLEIRALDFASWRRFTDFCEWGTESELPNPKNARSVHCIPTLLCVRNQTCLSGIASRAFFIDLFCCHAGRKLDQLERAAMIGALEHGQIGDDHVDDILAR